MGKVMRNWLYTGLLKSAAILGRLSDKSRRAALSIDCSKQRAHQEALAWTALNNLDKKIAELLPNILNSNTFYVEAGANDGIKQSNTHFLEKIYGAKGLLIEASPSLYEKCLKNRSDENKFELCALVEDTYEKEYVELIYSNLMTVSKVSGDVIPIEHAQKGLAHFSGSLYEFPARARKLGDILEEQDIHTVDLLSLDLEGNELNALKGANLETGIIKNIVIEARNIEKVENFLNIYGYELISKLSIHDYLFTLN